MPRPVTETAYGPWQPFEPDETARVLAGLTVPWWIGGGFAIEAFVGRSFRPHGDVDVGLFRADQLAMRRHLSRFDVQAADPPGTLRPWREGETLPANVHDIWVRERPDGPWRFQLMIDERDGDDWVYRRDARIRRSVPTITWRRDGIAYLAPEIQLLYKSKGLRAKDRLDFATALPLLDARQREWLRASLTTVNPDHEWLARMRVSARSE